MQMINAVFSIEEFLEGDKTDEIRLAEPLATGAILLAEDGAGNLLGCVNFKVRGRRGYLDMLAVDPAQQGRGLAHRLVELKLHTQEHSYIFPLTFWLIDGIILKYVFAEISL
jgi:ribosomal protein S18 acetylase RimI-like enzyme